jgi:hypothetical protein
VTVETALTGKGSVTDSIGRDHRVSGKFEEAVAGQRESFLVLPIFDWGRKEEPERVMPLGILRVINKKSPLAGTSGVVPFAWDDICMFRFVAEIVGVITNYLQRAMEAEDHFERVIHGIKANVGAIALNLSHFVRRPETISINSERLKYVLSDSVALTRDLKWQIERNVAWYRPRFETGAP